MISAEQDRHNSFKGLKHYTWAVFQPHSLKQVLLSHFDTHFQVLLTVSEKRDFPGKYAAVSRNNSRRRQVSTGYVFPKHILTAQVAWSIFHGKAAAVNTDFDLCPYSWCFSASQSPTVLLKDPARPHPSELRLTYQQRSEVPGSWHGNITFVSSSGPKSYAKAPRLLTAELGSGKP